METTRTFSTNHDTSLQVHHTEISLLHLPDGVSHDLLDVLRLRGGPLLQTQPQDGPDVPPVREEEGDEGGRGVGGGGGALRPHHDIPPQGWLLLQPAPQSSHGHSRQLQAGASSTDYRSPLKTKS